jgi:TetR/AcrR family transcriptional regulator, tetracycline repressor protein
VTPPASGRETPLSRDEVIDAALELTRAVGVRGLTMRGLANALGVSPMATYHYVANKQELVHLVAEAVSSTWPKLEPSLQPWDEALRRHLLLIWETLRRYPGLGAHLMDQPASGVTHSTVDSGVDFFCTAGFPPTEAMLAWSLTETYLHGRLSIEARLHGLADAPGVLEGLRSRDYVEHAVDTLIEGLRARLLIVLDEGTDRTPI